MMFAPGSKAECLERFFTVAGGKDVDHPVVRPGAVLTVRSIDKIGGRISFEETGAETFNLAAFRDRSDG